MHLSESQAIDLREFIDQCKSLLSKREFQPESPYWLSGPDDDESESLCWECLHKRRPNAEWGEDLSGGYFCEEDSSEVCADCGKLLDYTLTDDGVDSELEHFAEYPFDWNIPQDCYEMARITYGVWHENADLMWRLYGVLVKGNNRPPEIVPPLPYEVFDP